MTAAFFSLWDLDTGTSLGTYATQAAAVEVVEALIETNGLAYLADLELIENQESAAPRRIAWETVFELREVHHER